MIDEELSPTAQSQIEDIISQLNNITMKNGANYKLLLYCNNYNHNNYC